MRERLFRLADKLRDCGSTASGVLEVELRRAANDDPSWVVEELVEALRC